MAQRPSMKRPSLPSDEPYKGTRPAAGLALSGLAAAVGYEAAARALRSHLQPFQWVNPLTDDTPSALAETRRMAYRPSPFAKTLYVAVWYASAYAFGETAPGVTPKIQVDLVDDATLSTLDTFTVDDLPQARNPSRGARLATSGLVSTSGLLSGLEVYASNAWIESPLSVSGLSGADGWLVVEATGAQVLAVGWVEVVNAEVG